jgi:hypothetical protein
VGDDEPVGDDAAEPAHERLQGGLGVAGRRLAPELVDDRVDADDAADLPRCDRERGDEGLRERTRGLDERTGGALDDDRPEHAHAGPAGSLCMHAHEPTRGAVRRSDGE